MNKEREKKITNAIKEIEIIKEKIEDILSDEQFAFDSMPEGLQSSERGMRSEECIDEMEDAINSLEECIESLEVI